MKAAFITHQHHIYNIHWRKRASAGEIVIWPFRFALELLSVIQSRHRRIHRAEFRSHPLYSVYLQLCMHILCVLCVYDMHSMNKVCAFAAVVAQACNIQPIMCTTLERTHLAVFPSVTWRHGIRRKRERIYFAQQTHNTQVELEEDFGCGLMSLLAVSSQVAMFSSSA